MLDRCPTCGKTTGTLMEVHPDKPGLIEILSGGAVNQGDFGQGALVQETINAFEASFRQRSWVPFPLSAELHS